MYGWVPYTEKGLMFDKMWVLKCGQTLWTLQATHNTILECIENLIFLLDRAFVYNLYIYLYMLSFICRDNNTLSYQYIYLQIRTQGIRGEYYTEFSILYQKAYITVTEEQVEAHESRTECSAYTSYNSPRLSCRWTNKRDGRQCVIYLTRLY